MCSQTRRELATLWWLGFKNQSHLWQLANGTGAILGVWYARGYMDTLHRFIWTSHEVNISVALFIPLDCAPLGWMRPLKHLNPHNPSARVHESGRLFIIRRLSPCLEQALSTSKYQQKDYICRKTGNRTVTSPLKRRDGKVTRWDGTSVFGCYFVMIYGFITCALSKQSVAVMRFRMPEAQPTSSSWPIRCMPSIEYPIPRKYSCLYLHAGREQTQTDW